MLIKFLTKFFILFFFISFISISSLQARSSVPLSLDDPAYEKLDILRATGLIRSQIVGARPYSREEAARLIQEANESFEKKDSNLKSRVFLQELLDELNKSFIHELALFKGEHGKQTNNVVIKPVESISFEFAVLNDDSRQIPSYNGLGPIESKYQPLSFYKQGRDYVEGAQYNISSRHWMQFSPYLNLFFSPRVQFQFPHNELLDQDQFFIDELQATLQFKNLRLSVGRTPLILGQSSYGGFILSSEARAVDQIILTNDHPFYFPWIFKYLGNQKITAFFGTLGPESFFKDTLLAGYKWSMKPLSRWEIGLSNVMTIGGEGAPGFGPKDFIADFVGFSGTSVGASNRLLGIESRIGIPSWSGLEIYAEAFWDDKTFKSMKRTLVDTVAYKLGLYMPRLSANGRLSGKFEAKYISALFYRHGQFRSGYTVNNEILGDPLGPDSLGFFLDMAYALNVHTVFKGGLAYFSADSDIYSNTGTAISKITNNNMESHHLFSLGLQKKFKLCDLDGELVYDHVRQKDFGTANTNDLLFRFQLKKNW